MSVTIHYKRLMDQHHHDFVRNLAQTDATDEKVGQAFRTYLRVQECYHAKIKPGEVCKECGAKTTVLINYDFKLRS
jgi:hypothetical protein